MSGQYADFSLGGIELYHPDLILVKYSLRGDDPKKETVLICQFTYRAFLCLTLSVRTLLTHRQCFLR